MGSSAQCCDHLLVFRPRRAIYEADILKFLPPWNQLRLCPFSLWKTSLTYLSELYVMIGPLNLNC